jgi:hypothetical protein
LSDLFRLCSAESQRPSKALTSAERRRRRSAPILGRRRRSEQHRKQNPAYRPTRGYRLGDLKLWELDSVLHMEAVSFRWPVITHMRLSDDYQPEAHRIRPGQASELQSVPKPCAAGSNPAGGTTAGGTTRWVYTIADQCKRRSNLARTGPLKSDNARTFGTVRVAPDMVRQHGCARRAGLRFGTISIGCRRE